MISLYLARRSWAHRLPPRLKLVGLAAAGMALLPASDPLVLAALLAGVLGLYGALGRDGLAQVAAVRPLALVLAVILALHWIGGSLTDGVVAVLRLLVMVLLANFVSVTTRMDDMLDAVAPLFAPMRLIGLSPRKPALAVTLVLRFVPVLLAVFAGLREAYQARTGGRTSWRLVAPFALQALALSDHVAEALTARGGADGLKD
ncbi:energy-coupling factor transporter transmembrane component T family protein [Polymorphum gilvum]|uniref:Putative ABC transporter, inner membrane subunit n=1 Tax=Polymorphum gilvum (strain LMG 25793 / CGMCC 1.9160 / SL003B-26A1) TaxID=991905 RepID=F2J4T8_POLGS|nr:energy-coupling factor transporter transmembrane protein EcfT [Polymorphum gilvum]ADZ69030.1 Putative ABC transporter, inner membrane subunit [Polymorphum gilvum SL003B-26A1]